MTLIKTKGRYPWGPGAKFGGNHVSRYTTTCDNVVIRLDDHDHGDYWLELEIPAKLIEAWYHRLQLERADVDIKQLLTRVELGAAARTPADFVGIDVGQVEEVDEHECPCDQDEEPSQQPTTIGE